jgi:mono/diheme cytochrome c family protein
VPVRSAPGAHRLGLSFLIALLGAGPCGAQSAGGERDPSQVYAATCHFCHDSGIGVALQGTHLPPDLIRHTVRHGHGAMIAFTPAEIGDRELAALAQWLSAAAPPQTAADAAR